MERGGELTSPSEKGRSPIEQRLVTREGDSSKDTESSCRPRDCQLSQRSPLPIFTLSAESIIEPVSSLRARNLLFSLDFFVGSFLGQLLQG